MGILLTRCERHRS